MEANFNQAPETPMLDLANDIARQRMAIEENSRQMSEDIKHYLKSYFKRSGNDEISLHSNPFKNKYGNSIVSIYLTKDDNIIVNGCSYDVEISQINPIEQALLFEHIMKELSNYNVYIVLEERYDPNDGTQTKVIGTFKDVHNAQVCLGDSVEEAQKNYPEIWDEWLKEKKPTLTNNKNEYNICSSSYYYNIRVIEQILE